MASFLLCFDYSMSFQARQGDLHAKRAMSRAKASNRHAFTL